MSEKCQKPKSANPKSLWMFAKIDPVKCVRKST